MTKPVIQVKDRFATNNLQLEGNRQRPLQGYLEAWERILIPKGGIESLTLTGTLYASAIAFSLSIGGFVATIAMVFVITMVVGGLVAVAMDNRLLVPFYLLLLMLGFGFILSFL